MSLAMLACSIGECALIVVDAQQGFSTLCPKELPVPGALAIVPRVNELLQLSWPQIHASQDWHPPDHCSFLGQRENIYPPHCVQGTPGAEFLPGLHTQRFQVIWRKGFERDREAYAITAQLPGFAALLKRNRMRRAFICGLATNICCFYTARDLRQAGLQVAIVEDASAGIDVPAANLFQASAREAAIRQGIHYLSTSQVIAGVEE
jgi:nicotinamidase/pyrazinamidase